MGKEILSILLEILFTILLSFLVIFILIKLVGFCFGIVFSFKKVIGIYVLILLFRFTTESWRFKEK